MLSVVMRSLAVRILEMPELAALAYLALSPVLRSHMQVAAVAAQTLWTQPVPVAQVVVAQELIVQQPQEMEQTD